jgi:phosphoribosylformylglycinamidine cyclo-ligase
MGAKPEVVLDIILCGKFEKDIVLRVVGGIAQACAAQGCSLLGGETSEQPRVLPAGGYMLNATAVGVVEKSRIIDGSKIQTGHRVVALASNGLHTNGYSLVRKLMEEQPAFLEGSVGSETVLDVILRPHYCYYPVLKTLFPEDILLGLAHITGGGIEGNLDRILPAGTAALIDLAKLRVPEIFRRVRQFGAVDDTDMLRTFNMGVGLTAVVKPENVDHLVARCREFSLDAYDIGAIVQGEGNVRFQNSLSW